MGRSNTKRETGLPDEAPQARSRGTGNVERGTGTGERVHGKGGRGKREESSAAHDCDCTRLASQVQDASDGTDTDAAVRKILMARIEADPFMAALLAAARAGDDDVDAESRGVETPR